MDRRCVLLTGARWFSAVVVLALDHVQLPALLQLIQGGGGRHLRKIMEHIDVQLHRDELYRQQDKMDASPELEFTCCRRGYNPSG